MQASILNVYNRLLNGWKSLEASKKIKIVATAVVIILALIITLYFLLKPKMVLLERNLDPGTLSGMQTVLKDNNIAYNITSNTTAIEVKEKDLDQARVLLADNGYFNARFTYADAIDLNNMGMTETVRKQIFQYQKEEQIAATIELMEAVKSAKVNLALPESTPFLEDANKPTASVVVELTDGSLSNKSILAIANITAKSVENLDLENVSISDTDGNLLYDSSDEGAGGALASQYERELLEEKNIETKVKSILGNTYDDVQVAVSVKMEWNSESSIRTTVAPPVEDATTGVPLKQTNEKSSVTNEGGDQAVGMDANNLETPTYPTGSSGTSEGSSSRTETEYAYNTSTITEEKAVGILVPEESSLTVFVFNHRTYNEQELTEAEALGEMSWTAYKEDVRSRQDTFEVDPQITEAIVLATGISNISVVGMEKPIFEDFYRESRQIDQLLMAALLLLLIGLLAFALIRKTQPDEITEIEPELSVEELLVSDGIGGMETAHEVVPAIDYTIDSDLKRQIDKFIDDKPEAAAQLLRNWLSDEWE